MGIGIYSLVLVHGSPLFVWLFLSNYVCALFFFLFSPHQDDLNECMVCFLNVVTSCWLFHWWLNWCFPRELCVSKYAECPNWWRSSSGNLERWKSAKLGGWSELLWSFVTWSFLYVRLRYLWREQLEDLWACHIWRLNDHCRFYCSRGLPPRRIRECRNT